MFSYQLSRASKALVVWVVFSMVLSLFAPGIAAVPQAVAFTGGDGTEGNPYQIADWEDLADMADDLDAYYVLTTNLSSTTPDYDTYASSNANESAGWDPVGTVPAPFIGTLDGAGYTISDLVIRATGTDNVGLFGVVQNTTISRLNISNADVEGRDYVGVLAGQMLGVSTLSAVSVSDSSIVSTTDPVDGGQYVGGIAGYVYDVNFSNGYVRNLSIEAISAGEGTVSKIGLLFGEAAWDFVVTNVYTTGTIFGNAGVSVDPIIGTAPYHSYIIEDTFFDYDMYGGGPTPTAAGMDQSTTWLKNSANLITAGWDFDDVWDIDADINDGYPFLRAGAGLDLSEVADDEVAPGETLSIVDLEITGGSASDILDLNLYATGGEFAFTLEGAATSSGSGANIQFHGTRDDINATLATLTFTSEDSGEFLVEARLGGADGEIYNPDNEHIYQIVSNSLTWSQARDAAEEMEYGGVSGYLATIATLKEHSIIVERISGDGWIGATDSAVEDVWRWVTGPEAGQQFWQGNGSSTGGYAVDVMFSNWANNEPNDSEGAEDCAEFRTSQGGRWNDIGCNNPRPNFVVEFGTADNLPEVIQTSFTITVDMIVDGEVLSCGVVIDESGEYTLGADLTLGTFQEVCIDIRADDVELDGAGYSITGHNHTNKTRGVQVGSSTSLTSFDNVTINDMNISGFQDGVYVYNAENITITNNTISNIVDDAIDITEATDVFIAYNTISDSHDDAVQVELSEDVTVATNTANGIADDGFLFETIYGLLKVENNYLEDIGDDGIYLTETESFLVQNNTVNAAEIGIELNDDSSDSENRQIISNEIYAGEWAISLYDIDNVTVLNNYIQSDQWISNTDDSDGEYAATNVFNTNRQGNRYYFADGQGAWTVLDMKDNNGDDWADVGNDLPFAHGLMSSSEPATVSTEGEYPDDTYADVAEDNTALFDGNHVTGEAVVSPVARAEIVYDLPEEAQNVQWHVVHTGGESVIDIPATCYIGEWNSPTAYLELVVDNEDLRLEFDCATDYPEGPAWNDDFGEVVTAGLSAPISIYEMWITYDTEEVDMVWEGEGQDAHPYTQSRVGGSSSGGSSNSPTPRLLKNTQTTIAGLTARLRSLIGEFVAMGGVPTPAMQAILNSVPAAGGNVTTPTTCNYGIRDLARGDSGEDVTKLQQLLMKLGYAIPPGATGYFVNYTQTALSQYQKDNNINPSVGYFGCITKTQMKNAGHAVWW